MATSEIAIIEPEVQNMNTKTESVSVTELNRALIESMSKQVRLVDSQNGLDLFCYIKCGASDSDALKKCRGIVFNGDKLIINGFPYTYEFTETNEKEILKQINENLDNCTFYDSYEGALIRMFNFNNQWYITTNRKLDANKSKWSSKESFGRFFELALESEVEVNERLRENLPKDETLTLTQKFQTLLDKNKQYMFLLLNNNENRIVCDCPERPIFFHVGTFINGVLNMDEDIFVPYPQKHTFNNLNDIFKHVDKVDISKLQGIIVFAPNNIQYKIFNKEYNEYYRVRGNEPSIKFRYLQVRMDKRYNNLLHYLYPSFSKIFDDYENIIYQIGKNIHKAYFERFIRNQYIKVPPEEFAVIKMCHSFHLENRTENKINLNKVLECLNKQPATNINKMIRRFYNEEKEKNESEEPEKPKRQTFLKK